MSNPRISTCLFCDDIRQEIGNKISLMGVYSAEIIFPISPPVVMPRLALMVLLVTELDDIPGYLKVRVLAPPNRTEILSFGDELVLSPGHTEGAQKIVWRTLAWLPPFQITEQGYLEVMVDSGLGEERAGRIHLSFEPPSSAEAKV